MTVDHERGEEPIVARRFTADVPIDSLITWAMIQGHTNRILLVGPSERFGKMIKRSPIRKFHACAWPGTNACPSGRAQITVYELDQALKTTIAQIENKLSNWSLSAARQLPEDICLFENGANLPFFFCITHENDAWSIGESPPPFARNVKRITATRSELMLPEGECFCEVRLTRRESKAKRR